MVTSSLHTVECSSFFFFSNVIWLDLISGIWCLVQTFFCLLEYHTSSFPPHWHLFLGLLSSAFWFYYIYPTFYPTLCAPSLFYFSHWHVSASNNICYLPFIYFSSLLEYSAWHVVATQYVFVEWMNGVFWQHHFLNGLLFSPWFEVLLLGLLVLLLVLLLLLCVILIKLYKPPGINTDSSNVFNTWIWCSVVLRSVAFSPCHPLVRKIVFLCFTET